MNQAIEAKARKFFQTAFDGVIRIEVTDKNYSIWVDGREMPPIISQSAPTGFEKGFCFWRTKEDTLETIMVPEPRRLESAFIAGHLQISGDMAVMARLETGPIKDQTASP